jgi:hypothetical protein
MRVVAVQGHVDVEQWPSLIKITQSAQHQTDRHSAVYNDDRCSYGKHTTYSHNAPTSKQENRSHSIYSEIQQSKAQQAAAPARVLQDRAPRKPAWLALFFVLLVLLVHFPADNTTVGGAGQHEHKETGAYRISRTAS